MAHTRRPRPSRKVANVQRIRSRGQGIQGSERRSGPSPSSRRHEPLLSPRRRRGRAGARGRARRPAGETEARSTPGRGRASRPSRPKIEKDRAQRHPRDATERGGAGPATPGGGPPVPGLCMLGRPWGCRNGGPALASTLPRSDSWPGLPTSRGSTPWSSPLRKRVRARHRAPSRWGDPTAIGSPAANCPGAAIPRARPRHS